MGDCNLISPSDEDVVHLGLAVASGEAGYDNILDVESSIFSYIKRRNLSPVTGVYHVVLHNDLPLENLISYVGTNSNIL